MNEKLKPQGGGFHVNIQDGRSLCENFPSRLRSEFEVIYDKAGGKQGIMWVKPEEVLLANALW